MVRFGIGKIRLHRVRRRRCYGPPSTQLYEATAVRRRTRPPFFIYIYTRLARQRETRRRIARLFYVFTACARRGTDGIRFRPATTTPCAVIFLRTYANRIRPPIGHYLTLLCRRREIPNRTKITSPRATLT